MSSTINQKQSFWKMVEAQLRSTLVGVSSGRATKLTAEDSATWARTLVTLCLIVQDILPDGSRRRNDASLKQWCLAMASVDILLLAKAIKEFQLFIRTYPDEWAFLDWSDFKHRFPYGFTGQYFSPVRDILLSYLADPNYAYFKVLNQWISFTLKITLEGLSSRLTQQAEQDYLINEDRLGKLEFDDDAIDAVANVLGDWFSGFSVPESFIPNHSNGAVSNRLTKDGSLGKYRDMIADTKVSFLYRRLGLSTSEYGFGLFPTHTPDVSLPCAKLITVPKGIDKRRTICPEPVEYQFNQQGVWRLLDTYIQQHPILRLHICIHDQSVNRQAAIGASKFCDAATIDLSSASDSVSWSLVKRIFRHCPLLLWMMWSTRSTAITLPSGKTVVTNKYAPMGSALCFPIESIIFAAICQVACNTAHVHTRDTYHVYGDDIIIPAYAYPRTCELLTHFGFLVNTQKTFDPYCRYKESCGIEGLDGHDVSCIGISRKFSAAAITRDRPKLVSCYISFVNDLYEWGFMAARRYILACVLELPKGLIPPFSGDRRFGIMTVEPTNWLSERRYSERYHCYEILVGCFASSKDRSSFATSPDITEELYGGDYDDIRYHSTLRRLAVTKRLSLSDPDDLIQVSLSKSSLRLVKRWCPEWWFLIPLFSPPTITTNNETLQFSLEREQFECVDGE